MTLRSFKVWLELKERKPTFFTAMADLGIPPETMKTVPVTFAQGEMGSGGVRDLATYVATDDPEEKGDGSFVSKMRNMDDRSNKTQKRYRKVRGQWVLIPRDKNGNYPEDDKDYYTVKDDDLDGIYTQFLKKGGGGIATGLPGQGMGGM